MAPSGAAFMSRASQVWAGADEESVIVLTDDSTGSLTLRYLHRAAWRDGARCDAWFCRGARQHKIEDV